MTANKAADIAWERRARGIMFTVEFAGGQTWGQERSRARRDQRFACRCQPYGGIDTIVQYRATVLPDTFAA